MNATVAIASQRSNIDNKISSQLRLSREHRQQHRRHRQNSKNTCNLQKAASEKKLQKMF